MNDKLKELIEWIPTIKQMTSMDAAICVWNKDGVVEAFFGAKSIELHFEVGYQMPDKNDKLYDVIRTGKAQYNKVPKEVFGVAIEGTITPIFDGTEVVGVVTYVFSSANKEDIMTNADDLSNSIAKTEYYIEEINKGTKELESNMSQVQKITELVRLQVEEANSVVNQIQRNANYSNILALNASIESARAGQAGRGFAVVSEEMGKFSKMSGEAAAKINQNLAEIVKSLNDMTSSIDHSAEIAAEQSKSASELNEMFEEVTVIADKVTEICKSGL